MTSGRTNNPPAHACRHTHQPTAAERATPLIPGGLKTWLLAFFAAATLYWLTYAPGVQWQDSGEFQLRVLRHEVAHRMGLVLAHPVHHWLCRAVASVGVEPADAVTLVSVVTSAAMIANVALLLRLFGATPLCLFFSASALAVAHTVWMHATISEVYGVVGLTLSAEFACLAAYFRSRRPAWLVLVALINGVGVANHLLCGLVTPVHAAVAAWALLRLHRAPGMLALAVVTWIAGCAPYLWMIAGEAQVRGWAAAIHSAMISEYDRQVTNVRLSARMFGLTFGYIIYNFPNLALPLAINSVRNRFIPPVFYRILVIDLVIFLVFAMRYDVPDQFVFFYPCYPLIAILAGLGLDNLLRPARDVPAMGTSRRGRLLALLAIASVAVTPLLYYGAYAIVRERGWLSGLAARKPYRDGLAMYLLPWNHTKLHARMLNDTIVQVGGPHPLILCADPMVEFALLYAVQRRPELNWEIVPIPEYGPAPEAALQQARDALTRKRTVILVPRDRDNPPPAFPSETWQRQGDLYTLSPSP